MSGSLQGSAPVSPRSVSGSSISSGAAVDITFDAPQGAAGSNRLSLQAVNARIALNGTQGKVYFDITFVRKNFNKKNAAVDFTPAELQDLARRVEAAALHLSPAEVDAMDEFRLNFTRTRKDGADERPNFTFKSLSTRQSGESNFNVVDVNANQPLHMAITTDLVAVLTRVHNAVLDRTKEDEDAAPAAQTPPATPRGAQAAAQSRNSGDGQDAATQGIERNGRRERTDRKHQVSARAEVQEDDREDDSAGLQLPSFASQRQAARNSSRGNVDDVPFGQL